MVSFGFLLILLIGVATLVGAVALTFALLSNAKTRPIGLGVLLILGLLVLATPVVMYLFTSRQMESREQAVRQEQARSLEEIGKRLQSHPEDISAIPEDAAFEKKESASKSFGFAANEPDGAERAVAASDSASSSDFSRTEFRNLSRGPEHPVTAHTENIAVGVPVMIIFIGIILLSVFVFCKSARPAIKKVAGLAAILIVGLYLLRSREVRNQSANFEAPKAEAVNEEPDPLDDLFGSPALIPLGSEESEPDKKDPHSPGAAPEPDDEPNDDKEDSNRAKTKTVSLTKNSAADHAKPEWVLHPPKRVGGEMRRVVDAGPYKTVDECQQEIDQRIGDATWEFVSATLGMDQGTDKKVNPFKVRITDAYKQYPMQQLGINPLFVRGRLCQDEFIETVESPSLGEMKRVYVLMQFDTKLQKELREKWKVIQAENARKFSNRVKRWRMAEVGGVATFVLSLLGIIWGSFKIDTATKGFYTKWLIFGAIAATMGAGLLACGVSESVYVLLR